MAKKAKKKGGGNRTRTQRKAFLFFREHLQCARHAIVITCSTPS
jgi:hypothetical protein